MQKYFQPLDKLYYTAKPKKRPFPVENGIYLKRNCGFLFSTIRRHPLPFRQHTELIVNGINSYQCLPSVGTLLNRKSFKIMHKREKRNESMADLRLGSMKSNGNKPKGSAKHMKLQEGAHSRAAHVSIHHVKQLLADCF